MEKKKALTKAAAYTPKGNGIKESNVRWEMCYAVVIIFASKCCRNNNLSTVTAST